MKYEEYFINITTDCVDSGRGTYLTDADEDIYISSNSKSVAQTANNIKCIQKRLHLTSRFVSCIGNLYADRNDKVGV